MRPPPANRVYCLYIDLSPPSLLFSSPLCSRRFFLTFVLSFSFSLCISTHTLFVSFYNILPLFCSPRFLGQFVPFQHGTVSSNKRHHEALRFIKTTPVGHVQTSSPQILTGGLSSSRLDSPRKASRAKIHRLRTSVSSKFTVLPGRQPRTDANHNR